ncbi:helix-turn-helix domain-containing protein [Fluviibacterium sp. S390]
MRVYGGGFLLNEFNQKRAPQVDGLRMRSTLIKHASLQAALQPWVQMECFQLSRGKSLGRLDSIDLDSKKVVRETQNAGVQKLGATPANLCTVSYSSFDPALRFADHDAGTADTIFFMPEKTDFDVYVPAGAQTTYVSLDQDEFLRQARILNPSVWDTLQGGVTVLRSGQKALLKDTVETCFMVAGGTAGSCPAFDMSGLRRLLHQAILHIATTTQAAAIEVPHAARVRARRICRQAHAFAEERWSLHDPPTIVELCTAAGVSERTLQYAFRTHFGLSPMTYLRLLRLNRVRDILVDASPGTTSVTAIAMDHGFLHLGRFARDYKRLFGQSPSATLGR